ncbi:MAG: hypothetical protein K2M91_08975 [Lachnospiraceae bacterium]|nr:hypothetical protein [Lachnospiraceae bacterium]
MKFLDELKDLGVDVDAGLERVMDDEPFYEMMLGMFIGSVNDNPIELADFDADDLEVLTTRVHILKGLTGNLEMTPLFDGYVQVLDFLRTNRPQEALKKYERLLPIQEAIMDCIKRHMNNE